MKIFPIRPSPGHFYKFHLFIKFCSYQKFSEKFEEILPGNGNKKLPENVFDLQEHYIYILDDFLIALKTIIIRYSIPSFQGDHIIFDEVVLSHLVPTIKIYEL
jgi:hypothetical protein